MLHEIICMDLSTGGMFVAQSGIPAGFCDKCGNPVVVDWIFCPKCGNNLNTNTRLIQDVDLTTPRYGIASPQPQTDFKQTLEETQEKFQQAITSTVNPYADWGKLVLNDSSQRMWEEKTGEGVSCQYRGNTFVIDKLGSSFARGHTFSDFAFHVLVQMTYPLYSSSAERVMRAGLLFRHDGQTTGYRLGLEQKVEDDRHYPQLNITAGLGTTYSVITHQFIPSDAAAPGWANVVLANPNLLAIVAQGTRLDVYLNLVHVKRLHDYNISSGMVGIYVSGKHSAMFSNAKVWVKE
jgi:hypothetical protein